MTDSTHDAQADQVTASETPADETLVPEQDPASRAFFLGVTGLVLGIFVDLLLGVFISSPGWAPVAIGIAIGLALGWKERFLGLGFILGVVVIEAGLIWLIADA